MVNNVRRLLLTPSAVRAFALATTLALVVPGVAWAQKGGGSHGGGSRTSGGAKRGTSGTVHVKGYTKADGTRVEGYDREPSLGEIARASAAARSTRTPG